MLSRMRLVFTLLLVALAAVPAAAQTSDPFTPAVDAQIDGLIVATEALRGLTTLTPVERAFPTRAETIAYLTDLYNVELPDDVAARQTRFYTALDLLPVGIDLRGEYLALLGQQIAGFYDTDTNIMNVIPIVGDDVESGLSLTEQIIFVHEYTHALQDQHFDLVALLNDETVAAHPDRSLATLSLIEGDASAVMQVYTQAAVNANPLAAFAILAEGLQSGGLTLPPGIPDILGRELLFPYEQGLTFVVALYEAGGWEAINAAFANPPTTTEQILRPDAYLNDEVGQAVTLPDYAPILGADWERLWDTTLGQFYLHAFLNVQVPNSAASAASGWGGDAFQIWTRGADTAWMLRLRWDAITDQREFADALMAYGAARFGAEVAPGCWANDQAALCFMGSEAVGSLVVSAPTLAQAEALLAVRP